MALFLEQPLKFNGTNLFLGNMRSSSLFFAHNQSSSPFLQELRPASWLSFANGKAGAEWEKEKLGKRLLDKVVVDEEGDLDWVKEGVFKVGECGWRDAEDRDKWARVDKYSEEEKWENAGMFLNRHFESVGKDQAEYATVSSTVAVLTSEFKLYVWERSYDHGKLREATSKECEWEKRIRGWDEKIGETDFARVTYTENMVVH